MMVDVACDHLRDALHRGVGEAARGGQPLAKMRDVGAARDLGEPVVAHVGDEQPRGDGADVDGGEPPGLAHVVLLGDRRAFRRPRVLRQSRTSAVRTDRIRLGEHVDADRIVDPHQRERDVSVQALHAERIALAGDPD